MLGQPRLRHGTIAARGRRQGQSRRAVHGWLRFADVENEKDKESVTLLVHRGVIKQPYCGKHVVLLRTVTVASLSFFYGL
jgi:hypothetical protein